MDKITDGGLLALAGAGFGPCLEHLEFRGVSADLSSIPGGFRWFLSLPSPPPSSALIVLLIFEFICW